MSRFDHLYTAHYEKYVEEILARGLGVAACGLDPLSTVLRGEAKTRHQKNDSAIELVREWEALNTALEEHTALFAGTRIELPSISEFEDQGIVDFELLQQKYLDCLVAGAKPQILITPNFYRDEEYYDNLCTDNGLVIHEVDEYLEEIAQLDENMFSQRDFLYIDNGSPLYIDSPVSWTVSIADIDPKNKHVASIFQGFGSKIFYFEYIVMQLLLRRRGDKMLDMRDDSHGIAFHIIQKDKNNFFIFGINNDGNVLNISKYDKDDVLSSKPRKIVRNVFTAPGSGDIS